MSSSEDIEIGNIYKIAANEENGITPPDGRDVWFKHFVVMGKAPDGSVYGCVVFDSEMNREYVEPRQSRKVSGTGIHHVMMRGRSQFLMVFLGVWA